jgi:hypothetical protein
MKTRRWSISAIRGKTEMLCKGEQKESWELAKSERRSMAAVHRIGMY